MYMISTKSAKYAVHSCVLLLAFCLCIVTMQPPGLAPSTPIAHWYSHLGHRHAVLVGILMGIHMRQKQVYSGGGKNFSNICYAGTL